MYYSVQTGFNRSVNLRVPRQEGNNVFPQYF
jgi:hypothetical protein